MALEKLNKVELNDIFYGLDGRMLLLKCYFEMNEELALLNAMQTFSQFVNRKKAVASTHQKNYSNFMKYLKYLFKNNNSQKLTVLYDKVSQSKNIADKNWLLQTISQKIDSK
jgi:hypothetical protein